MFLRSKTLVCERFSFLAAALFAVVSLAASAPAQTFGTAFTYQGALRESGSPVNGTRDLTFRLFDASSGGSQIGSDIAMTGVTVSDGLFAVSLDFGASAFDGGERWLEVEVGGGVGVLLPRQELTPAPHALYAVEASTAATAASAAIATFASDADMLDGLNSTDFLPYSGDAFIVVQTTNDAVANGANLLAAYATASALTPNSSPLSADNRVALLVPPGSYDLGTSSLTLDTDFVHLIGLSSDPRNQYIFGESSGVGTGVLIQAANNVTIENLSVECTRSSGGVSGNMDDPAAYALDFLSAPFPDTVIRNCVFEADGSNAFHMTVDTEYSGYYERVVAGNYSFGGGENGIASGTFIDCVGADFSFGGNLGTGGTASGTFTNCSAGNFSFAGGSGGEGTASGTFTNCSAGTFSFAGGGGVGGTASGTFTNCSAGNFSFAGSSSIGGLANGVFSHCKGGLRSFGGGSVDGTAPGGRFYFCEGGSDSFTEDAGGGAAPIHLFCIADGAQYSGND